MGLCGSTLRNTEVEILPNTRLTSALPASTNDLPAAAASKEESTSVIQRVNPLMSSELRPVVHEEGSPSELPNAVNFFPESETELLEEALNELDELVLVVAEDGKRIIYPSPLKVLEKSFEMQ